MLWVPCDNIQVIWPTAAHLVSSYTLQQQYFKDISANIVCCTAIVNFRQVSIGWNPCTTNAFLKKGLLLSFMIFFDFYDIFVDHDQSLLTKVPKNLTFEITLLK